MLDTFFSAHDFVSAAVNGIKGKFMFDTEKKIYVLEK
jgi:hypothetical protein